MAVVNVSERFFDITLSSNSFQDIFPLNTVSSFRAKLPVTLMFPPNVPYKVALHKLTFINSINNIGRGAKTELWVAQNTVNPTEVFLPDICIDSVDDFSHFLEGQLQHAARTYFLSNPSKAISITPYNLGFRTSPSNIHVGDDKSIQADSPTETASDDPNVLLQEDASSASERSSLDQTAASTFKTRIQNDMEYLEVIRDDIFKILFSSNYLYDSLRYFYFASRFRQYYLTFIRFKNQAFSHKQTWDEYADKGFLEPWPYADLISQLDILNNLADEHILPYVNTPIFPELPEYVRRYDKLARAVRIESVTLFSDFPELRKKFPAPSDRGPAMASQPVEFRALINHPIMMASYLDRIANEKTNDEQTQEFIIDLKNEFEKLAQERFQFIDTTLETLAGLLENIWTSSKTAGEVLSALVDEYNKFLEYKYNAVSFFRTTIETFPSQNEDSMKRFLFRPPELIVKNPLTNKVFENLDDFREFRRITWSNIKYRGLTPEELYSSVSKKVVNAYIKKRQQGIIKDSTPDSELTGDELFFRNFERSRSDRKPIPQKPPPIIVSPSAPSRREAPLRKETPSIDLNKKTVIDSEEDLIAEETTKQLPVAVALPQKAEKPVHIPVKYPPKRKTTPIPFTPPSEPKQPKNDFPSNKLPEEKSVEHDESKNTIQTSEEKEIETDKIEKPIQPQTLEQDEKEDESENIPVEQTAWEKERFRYLFPSDLILYLPYFLSSNQNHIRIFDSKAVTFSKDLPTKWTLHRKNPFLKNLSTQHFHYQFIPDGEIDKTGFYIRITRERKNYVSTILQSVQNVTKQDWNNEFKQIVNTYSHQPNIFTKVKPIAHLLSIHSSSPNFDFGMSFELLSMLGLESREEYLKERFQTRLDYRLILNQLKRDCIQFEHDPRSLVNLYITGSNMLFSEDVNQTVDKKSQSSFDSVIDGEKILIFKKLFLEQNLQLSDESNPLYQKYIYFLSHELGFSQPALIYPGNISRRGGLKFGTVEQKETFFKTFYSSFGVNASKQTMLLDIDFITFLLWICASEMPLSEAIVARNVPKLNPMSQMWIYTNIVKESIVNNEYKKILAMGSIPSNKEKGHELEITFTEPLFKTLGVSRIDEINIIIATKFGNPCPFADGPSTVQLRFEADSPSYI